jgi:hypothetical protein
MKVIAIIILVLHGLIHLMGTVTYMQLGTVQGLAYKTTLLNGRWDLGAGGIGIYGALWAVTAVGFIAIAATLPFGWRWWKPVLAGIAVFSLILTALDWKVASAGAILNLVILTWLWFSQSILK